MRFQQGFFTVARTCPQCRGNGKIVASPCQTCRGAGRVSRERKLTVKIPAGIATGQQLRLQGEGESGTLGGPAGHLYVVVQVQEHKFFRRDGNNLFCEIPVNFTTVALGGEIQVPTLDGTEPVKVPEGTQTGTTLRLRGKGMPDVNGRGRGDLFATVQVQTPKKLNREQRRLLEQLAKALPAEKVRAAGRARTRTSAICSIASRTCSADARVEGLPRPRHPLDRPRHRVRARSTTSRRPRSKSATTACAPSSARAAARDRALRRARTAVRRVSSVDVTGRRLGAAFAGPSRGHHGRDESWSCRPDAWDESRPGSRPHVIRLIDRDPHPAVDGLRHRAPRDDAAVSRGAADARPDGDAVSRRRHRIRHPGDRRRLAGARGDRHRLRRGRDPVRPREPHTNPDSR